jgi:conjugal transfer pilus assembly protein TraV
MVRLILIFSLLLVLTSCSARYACKDRVDIEGEKCDPITTVYEKKILGSDGPSPKERPKKTKTEKSVRDGSASGGEERVSTPSEDVDTVRSLYYGEEKPLRLPPRVIRIWVAPWEDSDGDLHQPSYIYSEISPRRGRWLFGEKEVITTQPILRPMEKPSEDLKKRESEKKEEQKKREYKKGEREKIKEPLRLPIQPNLKP